ncbi:F-box protein, partial [Mucuna pruriens]
IRGRGELDMSLGFEDYNFTKALGRKRVVLLNNVGASSLDSNSEIRPLKRMCSEKITPNSERSPLEALPLDVLTRVLCGVDHEDLGQLVRVSKTIREACWVLLLQTEIARRMHFEYSTPKKKTFVIRRPLDIEGAGGFEEIEAPNAPLRRKPKSKLSGKNLASISVALFASTDEEE